MNLRFSTFRILVIFTLVAIIGGSLISVLKIRLTPEIENKSLNIYFEWPNSSARVIEKEITSKLEGGFNRVKGIKNINSISQKGNGSIRLDFKKEVDIDVARFEISNIIQNIYKAFPNDVSYPLISNNTSNINATPVLSYSINANAYPYFVKKKIESKILPDLTSIKGIDKIDIYGSTPFQWYIEYDSDILPKLQITVNDIETAIKTYFKKKDLGNVSVKSKSGNHDLLVSLQLSYKTDGDIDWLSIPIKKINNRIIYLRDIAKVNYKEGKIKSYYRIDGLNTVYLVIYPKNNINNIKLAKVIKQKIEELKSILPDEYQIKLTQDNAEYINEELQKIIKRTLLTFLILTIFILIIYRSIKYLIVLLLSIIINLLIAVVFYYCLNVQLQLYSFAGITISFGIIIDNTIIMIDHLKNKKDKKVFLAIMASSFTTIGSLLVIFLLEDNQRANLWDFALVIAINVGVSLLVSFYFVSALLNRMKLKKEKNFSHYRRSRFNHALKKRYELIIHWMCKPKQKWSLIIILIISFGLPINLLPKKIESDLLLAKLYNYVTEFEVYDIKLRPKLEKIFGGSLRLFTEEVFLNSYYNHPERTSLRVSGSMPDGATIEQLNEAILELEKYLQKFNEISLYETSITDSKSSNIIIYFKPKYELLGFPYILKSLLEAKSISLGGVDWSITGVGRGFSNALNSGYKNNRIVLEGYNYDKLYFYAEILKKQLEKNDLNRVKNVEIVNSNSNLLNEYYLDFNKKEIAILGLTQKEVYNYLKNQSHSKNIYNVMDEHELKKIDLISKNYGKFNVWDLKHSPINIGGKSYKLEQIAHIEKMKIGNSIQKRNQQYRLTVAYDVLGTQYLAKKIRKNNMRKIKSKLPLGYRVLEKTNGEWNKEDTKQYYYIFVVIFIIFLICSILLESLRQSLIIISMIPISFIGVFLTFYLFSFNFDQGGYASFILLCGISVNSALFIVNDYNNLVLQYPKRNKKDLYFKAFSYKITAIILTIISTIIGLLPFIWNNQNEAFWFSFAVGSIGGLLLSIIGILFYLPIFSLNNKVIL